MTTPVVSPKRCAACGHVLGAAQKPLTKIEAALLQVIGHRIVAHGCAPTYDDLRSAFRWRSTGTVAMHLVALEAKGYIRREPRTARGLTLLVSFDEIGSLPVETKRS